MRNLLLFFVVLMLSACSTGNIRSKGGVVTHKSATGSSITQTQSEDPKTPSVIKTQSKITKTLPLPPGTIIEVTNGITAYKYILKTNSVYTEVIEDKADATTGAAQKNIVGETIAKLNSMKWIQGAGVLIFLFGLATFTPWLRPIIGSITTSVLIVVGGILLIILPILLVGNEGLILCVMAVPLIWFFAHRHAEHKTKAEVYKSVIDNTITIDDKTKI